MVRWNSDLCEKEIEKRVAMGLITIPLSKRFAALLKVFHLSY